MTQDELKAVLIYNPDTGDFVWKSTGPGRRLNKSAGTTHKNGYVYINIGGTPTLAHRLAWLYIYGELPSFQIDHINHDRSDNRITNLRATDNRGNSRNRKKSDKNTSGCTGVYWDKGIRKWKDTIRTENKQVHLGCSESFEEMVLLRKEAEIMHNYHPNHGK